jgi:hypothetical protein
MVYDASRQTVVLFGGSVNNGTDYKQDVWEFDGSTWVERSPATATPAPRPGYYIAYDPVRRKTVLFDGAHRQDTWEWDGHAGCGGGQVMYVNFTDTGLAVTPTMQSVTATFYSGGNSWGRSYYKKTDTKSFTAARAQCQSEGGRLAVITSPEDQAAVQTAVGAPGDAWIGLSDEAYEGRYLWEDGTEASYVNWSTGQPDDSGGAEDCVHVWATGPYQWNDAACSSAIPYVCEKYSALTGANLKVWYEGRWRTVDDNASAASATPALPFQTLAYTATDTVEMSKLFFGANKSLNFAVTPIGPNGKGMGEVAVDYAEVVVKYKLP